MRIRDTIVVIRPPLFTGLDRRMLGGKQKWHLITRRNTNYIFVVEL